MTNWSTWPACYPLAHAMAWTIGEVRGRWPWLFEEYMKTARFSHLEVAQILLTTNYILTLMDACGATPGELPSIIALGNAPAAGPQGPA
jgi:hypothetical protein